MVPGLAFEPRLDGVSCLTGRPCVAVGGSTVVTRGSSGWTVQSVPNATYDGLDSVSCGSSTSCVAVGEDSATAKPALVTWNGSSWAAQALPDSLVETIWNSVSCPTSDRCVAVGSVFTGTETQPVFYTESAGVWTSVPLPVTPDYTELTGVSCVSATACTAVGDVAGEQQPLVVTWTPGSTKLVELPTRPSPGVYWTGFGRISCVSAATCVATASSGVDDFLAVGSGGQWRVERIPPASLPQRLLNGVSCVSGGGCTAVGALEEHNDAGLDKALVAVRAKPIS